MVNICVYNEDMLESAISRIYDDFNRNKELNLTWEKKKKDKSLAQLGFFWGALVGSIRDFFLSKGIEYTPEDIKNNFYNAISYMDDRFKRKVRRFNGEEYEVPKRISEMNMEEMSRFIDRAIWLCDNAPMFSGLVLHPSIRYCFLNHITEEDLKNLDRRFPKISDEYRAYIRNQPCLVCGCFAGSCDPHHLRINNHGGVAMKPSDAFCIPLCHRHHQEYHRRGHLWFMNQVKWITRKVCLEDFCAINFNRWKNHF